MFCLFSVYWRVVNAANLLKYQRILFTFQFSVVYLILLFSSWVIQGHLTGALKCPVSVFLKYQLHILYCACSLILTPKGLCDFPFADSLHLVTQCIRSTTCGLGVSWGSRTPLACVSLHSCAVNVSNLHKDDFVMLLISSGLLVLCPFWHEMSEN